MLTLTRQSLIAQFRKIGFASFALATALICASQALAAPGDLYVSDLANNSIVVYKPDGSFSTFASGLNSPQGLAFDQVGNLFVADGGSGSIFKFSPDGLTKTTVVTGLSTPTGLARNGFDLIVSENSANQVISIDQGGLITTLPATVTSPLGVTAGSVNMTTSVYVGAANGTFKIEPNGTVTIIYSGSDGRYVAVDADGNAFLSLGMGEVQKFPFGGGPPTTFASGLNDPVGMAFRPKRFSGDTDGVGNLFVADPTGGFIFQITPDGTKTTFASGGKPNFLLFQTFQVGPTPTPTPTDPDALSFSFGNALPFAICHSDPDALACRHPGYPSQHLDPRRCADG